MNIYEPAINKIAERIEELENELEEFCITQDYSKFDFEQDCLLQDTDERDTLLENDNYISYYSFELLIKAYNLSLNFLKAQSDE